MTTLSGISTLSSRLSLLNDMFVLYSVQSDFSKKLRAINQTVQQHEDNYTSRSYILEKQLCQIFIRGGMNSRGAHEFGPTNGLSLIFCRQNLNENEVQLKGTINWNH
jgi:hypothetical protein